MTVNAKALRDCVILTAFLALVFLAFPSLDIAFSNLFYKTETGFWLADLHSVQWLREIIWQAIVLVALMSLVALGFTKVFRSTTPVLNKVWEVIVLTYLLGPALLVDAILKSHWGRARPSATTDFGGTAEFTPAFVLSDQCARNCSFVSGEGSGVTALLIAVLLIVHNQTPAWHHRWIKAGAFVLFVAGLSLRVLMGRHFLSDTLLAVLFVTMIALALLQLPRYRNLRLF
ncbi:phosphatase PAP2 family protein [Shimia sp.]|uniref:phosphatase PAP2 family protein n=1 Tax=Shimia sp. TaxID=1954381 RepID=UPI003B8E6C62